MARATFSTTSTGGQVRANVSQVGPSRVVRCVNLAAITGLFGGAAYMPD
jgi:hypothetical protein